MSTAGGVVKAIDRGESIGCTAMQIFVKGNTRWQFPPLDSAEAREFRRRMDDSPVRACIAHTVYLVNLAAVNPDVYGKSVDDMVDELTRCDALGIAGLVMHPGAHGGAGAEAGVARVAEALNAVFAATPDGRCRVLLETTAGQGTGLGASFGEIAAILDGVHDKDRVGVCLDTCHVFAAGYDIRTRAGYLAMWREFDRDIGLSNLRAIHLNDSKKPLGSNRDRHEQIGKGELGIEPFRFLVNDPRLRSVPMVLETDKGPEMLEDVENLALLRSLVK
jgi:deoxyribonuclease-4